MFVAVRQCTNTEKRQRLCQWRSLTDGGEICGIATRITRLDVARTPAAQMSYKGLCVWLFHAVAEVLPVRFTASTTSGVDDVDPTQGGEPGVRRRPMQGFPPRANRPSTVRCACTDWRTARPPEGKRGAVRVIRRL